MRNFIVFLLIASLTISVTALSKDAQTVVQNYFTTPEPTKELTDEFIEATDISQQLNGLPWSISNNIYQVFRLGSIGVQIMSLGAAAETANSASMWKMAASSSAMATTGNGGPLMATGLEMMINNTKNIWELLGLVQDMNEIFKSRPGSRLELMAVDFDSFAQMYMGLGALKVLGENWRSAENQLIFDKSLQLSMVAFVQSARQLAGMKKVSGGNIVAISIEAQLALALMELPEELQTFVMNYWDQGAQSIIKKEQSWFGEGREVFQAEVSDSLGELKTLTENPELRRGIRTGTYSAKVGTLTVGLAQLYFNTPEIALREIAEGQETLEKWGLDQTHLATILTPLTYSSSLILSGIELGVEWTLGPVAYMETLVGRLAGGMVNGVANTYDFLSHPGKNLGLNWVRDNSTAKATQATQLLTKLKPTRLIDSCGRLIFSGISTLPFRK